MLNLRLAVMSLAGLVWTGQPAFAQADADTRQDPGLVIEGALTIVSDYRFRGSSLSDGKPALQGELTVSHNSGIYVSAWGSSVADNDGADVETGLAIGLNKQIGPVQLDGSLFFYAYPGAGEANYVEATGRASVPLGGGEGGIAYAYAPAQKGTGGRANHYVSVAVELPLGHPSLTMDASLGLEQGAFGNSKFDWSIGASQNCGAIKLGLRYVDSRRGEAGVRSGAALVVSLTLAAQ